MRIFSQKFHNVDKGIAFHSHDRLSDGIFLKFQSLFCYEKDILQMSRRDLKFCSLFFSFQHQASNSKKVYLKGVTLKSTGLYRCEISAEEPDFKTVAGEGKLEVVCKWKHHGTPLTLLILCTIMFRSKQGLKTQEQQFRYIVHFLV